MALRRRRNRAATPEVDPGATDRRARRLLLARVLAVDPQRKHDSAEKVARVARDTADLPPAERLAAIEAVLAEVGLLERADRLARSLERERQR